jgi:riboflavin kinase/FMN adenylyltransferase
MQFFTSLAEVPAQFGPSAVTIGKFDGVHAGHRKVITELLRVAAVAGLTATVLTFDRNPLSLLSPADCPAPLISNDQKRDLLAEVGIEATVMLAFDRAFSNQSAEQFVRVILVDALQAKIVFVGADFRFGAQGSGDVAFLTELGDSYGFEVRSIEDVRPQGDRRVSSTWIRELLDEGEVAAATQLLGREPSVRGVVVHGQHRGKELGYPTANLSADMDGLIPADGVYAAWMTLNGRRYPAAASVGNNPTFDGVPDKQVEAYVLDETLDLYGLTVEISFVERIRGMEKFDSVDDLVTRIRHDVAQARQILGSAEPA